LEQFWELPHGIPSHDTFGRVISVIEPREFERCLLKWFDAQVKLEEREVIALDDKTLRRRILPSRSGNFRRQNPSGGWDKFGTDIFLNF
jgi:hypothetical protein